MELKNKLKKLIEIPLPNEEMLMRELVGIVYNEYKENTLKLFLEISELDKERLRKEKQILYKGLEDGMHNLSAISSNLLECKTSKQAKNFASHIFESSNPAMIINICKAYFPNAEPGNASGSGAWVFEKFKNIVLNNKEDFQEGGKSYDWAEIYNHSDYINLIIEKYDNLKYKPMKKILISHRGNLNGRIPERENTSEYIIEAIQAGFNVEIDVRMHKGILHLGHDKPEEIVPFTFFLEPLKDFIWFHCKDYESLLFLMQEKKYTYKCFIHDKEPCTFVSNGMLWVHPNFQTMAKMKTHRSIVMHPVNLHKAYVGYCADNIAEIRDIINKNQ